MGKTSSMAMLVVNWAKPGELSIQHIVTVVVVVFKKNHEKTERNLTAMYNFECLCIILMEAVNQVAASAADPEGGHDLTPVLVKTSHQKDGRHLCTLYFMFLGQTPVTILDRMLCLHQ